MKLKMVSEMGPWLKLIMVYVIFQETERICRFKGLRLPKNFQIMFNGSRNKQGQIADSLPLKSEINVGIHKRCRVWSVTMFCRNLSKPELNYHLTKSLIYETPCAIHGSLYNLKNVKKHTWKSVKAYNFTKSNTPPWVFFTSFKLSKWH